MYIERLHHQSQKGMTFLNLLLNVTEQGHTMEYPMVWVLVGLKSVICIMMVYALIYIL